MSVKININIFNYINKFVSINMKKLSACHHLVVNPPNVDTAGRFVRTHQALSMRVGKGKATSDMVHGSNKGREEEEMAPSVWKRSVVEKKREETQ